MEDCSARSTKWKSGNMVEVTDDMMKEFLAKVRPYTLMILHKTSKFKMPDVSATVWEHGRRNMQFRLEGKMNITCPVHDETDLAGIIVFSTDLEETRRIMDGDPGVKAGIFAYELHATKALPGSSLK